MAQPIQTRFDGGEISGRVSGRFDSDLYKKSLRTASNFEPTPQGSLRMRSGSELVQALLGDARTRLAPIRMSTGTDYLVELYDKVMRIYSLATGSAVQEVVHQFQVIYNGDFSFPNGAGWQGRADGGAVGNFDADHNNLVNFNDQFGTSWGKVRIVHNQNGEGVLYQRIVIPFNGTVRPTFRFYSNISAGAGKLLVKISTTDPAGWANIEASGGETFRYENVPPGLIVANSGDPNLGTYTQVDLGDVAINAGIYWISFQISQSDFNNGMLDNISLLATFGAAQTDIPTPWTADEVADVRFATETGRDRTIFVHGSHKPWALTYGGQPGNWSFGDVTFTNLPVSWGDAGSTNVPVGWNWQGITAALAQANWPSVIDEHDARVYYAGEPAQKNRILASRSGSADDFTLGSNPGDSLDFKLATKGAIRWMRSNRVMLVGTDLGQHSVTGSKGTPLVGDIQARPESAFPSAAVQAVAAGTKAMYISGDLRRLRAASFDFQTNGWESKDLTFAAEHITAGLIKELHHGWTPDSVVVLVLKSGIAVVCTFEPEEQVTAWWRVDLGTGVLCSAAITQVPLGAYMWMAVQRGAAVFLEKLHLSDGSEALRYLDASIAVVSDAAGQIAGLAGFLNGQNVRVVQNGGGLLGDFPVGIDGTAQLGIDNANTAVFAGVAYKAKAVTLPKDIRGGKSQSPKLGVVLNNSAHPKINGKRPADRSPSTPLGNVEPLATGKKQTGNLGWSDEDSITIEQDLPFRTEICAIYSTTTVGQEY
jgi:hypothetical protein